MEKQLIRQFTTTYMPDLDVGSCSRELRRSVLGLLLARIPGYIFFYYYSCNIDTDSVAFICAPTALDACLTVRPACVSVRTT